MSNLQNGEQTRSVISKELAAIAKEVGNTIAKAIQKHPVAGLCICGVALSSPFIYAVYKGDNLEMQLGIFSMKTSKSVA